MSEAYETNDLGLAAFLLAMKETLADTKREGNSKRVTFCFKMSKTTEQRAKDFLNDGQVGAKTYYHSLRDLKQVIFGGE